MKQIDMFEDTEDTDFATEDLDREVREYYYRQLWKAYEETKETDTDRSGSDS